MIIINKKRLCLIFVCIFVSVSVFTTGQNHTKEVVALPSSSKVVIIDAGHGLPDGGASNGSLLESDINLKIALKIQKLLEQSGTTVILTRSDENGISDVEANTIRKKHVSDLKNRVKIGNESSADIFVSIHLNKIPQEQYSGWQAFYKKDNDKSIKLANSIQNSLNQAIQKENKRSEGSEDSTKLVTEEEQGANSRNKREPAKISGIYIVDNVEIPLSIIECGFLSNNEETKLLNTDVYQDKLAWGIYNGIMDYFFTM